MTDMLVNGTQTELYFDWQVLAQMLKKIQNGILQLTPMK